MKQIYIKFKEEYVLCNKDYKEENLIYNREINMVAISNVKEILFNEENITIYFTNKREKVVYYTKSIKDFAIN